MQKEYNIIIEEGQDGYLISSVVELPGCHTQAKKFDDLMKRTKEAIELFLSVNKKNKSVSKFIGLQKMAV